jgi:hypothetical protein
MRMMAFSGKTGRRRDFYSSRVLQAKMAGHGEQYQHEKHDDQSIHSSLNPFP